MKSAAIRTYLLTIALVFIFSFRWEFGLEVALAHEAGGESIWDRGKDMFSITLFAALAHIAFIETWKKARFKNI